MKQRQCAYDFSSGNIILKVLDQIIERIEHPLKLVNYNVWSYISKVFFLHLHYIEAFRDEKLGVVGFILPGQTAG